jgi:hypothetical protein
MLEVFAKMLYNIYDYHALYVYHQLYTLSIGINSSQKYTLSADALSALSMCQAYIEMPGKLVSSTYHRILIPVHRKNSQICSRN